jgi:hypothetical protein
LPETLTEQMVQTIPSHRAKVKLLMDASIIKFYTLSADRKNLFILVDAINQSDLEAVIDSLPFSKFFEKFSFKQMMFSLTTNAEFPQFSLN